jgi:hypothetical protein
MAKYCREKCCCDSRKAVIIFNAVCMFLAIVYWIFQGTIVVHDMRKLHTCSDYCEGDQDERDRLTGNGDAGPWSCFTVRTIFFNSFSTVQ